MGKFSGILLCSDWDGTIHGAMGVLPKDIEAIRYFQANGGLFTICSGRQPAHLSALFTDFEPNTNIIALNGAIIADHRSGEIAYENYLDERAPKILEEFLAVGIPQIAVVVHYKGEVTPDRVIIENISDFREKLGGKRLYKMVIMTKDQETMRDAIRAIDEIDTRGYSVVRSWDTGLEIIKDENAKGAAVKRLARLTGAHTLVTVGDYENDIDMLQAADISYAVYNAPDNVKCHAKHHLPPSSTNGPINAVIEDLSKRVHYSAKK